ncbi:MAG: arsenate reductase ArsC, partial [Asgard group archaeon]
ASSAGKEPAEKVSPLVVEAMKEKGIDISKNKPKLLDKKIIEEANTIITMGCSVEESCPAPLFKKSINWELEDPKDKQLEKIRQIRDEIEKKVLNLVSEVD